jgi:PIN domain nuclease of toxin-antitoxin system
MRFLVETQVVLWSLGEPERLCAAARTALTSSTHTIHVSPVSVWEIEIKRGLVKLEVPLSFDELARLRWTELPVRIAHTRAVRGLPDHHREPFDRLLIAQARTESLTIVTSDPQIARYDVRVLKT